VGVPGSRHRAAPGGRRARRRRRAGRSRRGGAGAMKRFHLIRGSPEETLPPDAAGLVARVKELTPHADLDLIRRAYLFAREAHADQTRASGEPYVNHSVAGGSPDARVGARWASRAKRVDL